MFNRIWNLDVPVDLESLDMQSSKAANEYLRHVVFESLRDGYAAIHLFIHESDSLLRVVLGWRAPETSWHESVPLPAVVGQGVLKRLRSGLRRHDDGRMRGTLACRFQSKRIRINLESPHEWDVRLLLTTPTPAHWSYTLHIAEACAADAPPENGRLLP